MKLLLTLPFQIVCLGAAWLNYPAEAASLCGPTKENSWVIHTPWKTLSPLHLVLWVALRQQDQRKFVLCLQPWQGRRAEVFIQVPWWRWHTTALDALLQYHMKVHNASQSPVPKNVIPASKDVAFQLSLSTTFWEILRKSRKYIKTTKIKYSSWLSQHFEVVKFKIISSDAQNL